MGFQGTGSKTLRDSAQLSPDLFSFSLAGVRPVPLRAHDFKGYDFSAQNLVWNYLPLPPPRGRPGPKNISRRRPQLTVTNGSLEDPWGEIVPWTIHPSPNRWEFFYVIASSSLHRFYAMTLRLFFLDLFYMMANPVNYTQDSDFQV